MTGRSVRPSVRARGPGAGLLLLVLPLLAVVGCGDGSRGLVEEELELRFANWRSLGIRDYDFRYQESCPNCSPEREEEVRIEVRQDQVTAVIILATGAPRPAAELPDWPTVDRLFERLLAHLRRPGAQASVTFEADWPVPTTAIAFLDGSLEQGFTFVVADFTPR
jgi:hypothetical protein